MHPAISRFCMFVCAVAANVIFLIILFQVGRQNSVQQICSSSGISRPCWDWKFNKSKLFCMFHLLFAATVCLEAVILIFFTSSFMKCLFPEFAVIGQRRLCIRFVTRYLSVACNFASCVLALTFVAYILVHRNSTDSCYQFADITNSCILGEDSCLQFVLVVVGFVFTLFSTMFSAWDARFSYFVKKEDDERERIYQSYMDYNSIQEVNNF